MKIMETNEKVGGPFQVRKLVFLGGGFLATKQ